MSTEIAKNKTTEIRKLLSSDMVKNQIAKALPDICTPERFMRICVTAITKTPKLAECSQESLMSCLLDAAQLGLEPDGRKAHLIPYGNKCTLIIDYKGMVELVKRSGEVVTIHASAVCENDEFAANMGKIDRHVIDYKKERGPAYCYYAFAEMKDGSIQSEIMTLAEVMAIKKRSKSGNAGPWVTDFEEMAKKTVFRRLCKWLPMQSEAVQTLQKVEKMEFDFDMPPKREPEFKDAGDIDVDA